MEHAILEPNITNINFMEHAKIIVENMLNNLYMYGILLQNKIWINSRNTIKENKQDKYRYTWN